MAETTAERIARVLAERIVSGELAPGVPLRQDRVAAEFESSHVPAREAFQLLRAQGLLISEPRRGMRVAPLDHASMQEIVEIRASLEVLALTHAAPKLNAACLNKIERALLASCGRGQLPGMQRRRRDARGSWSRRPGRRFSRDDDAVSRTWQWPTPEFLEWRRAR